MGERRKPAGSKPRARKPVIEEAGPLDAEDLALARLQAELRKRERLPESRQADAAVGRTTLRLPGGLLARLRSRARRDKCTLSQVVAAALEKYLRHF